LVRSSPLCASFGAGMAKAEPPASPFPEPPPQWRLFGPDRRCRVAPPKPPAVPVQSSSSAAAQSSRGAGPLPPASASNDRQLRVFSQPRLLDLPASNFVPDWDEWLCNADAEDLGAEAVKVHRQLRCCTMQLLECLVQNPSDHQRPLRRFRQLTVNLGALLHKMRIREARALAVQRLRRQVAEKRAIAEELEAKLPLLRKRADDAIAGAPSTDAGAETAKEEQGEEPRAKKARCSMMENSTGAAASGEQPSSSHGRDSSSSTTAAERKGSSGTAAAADSVAAISEPGGPSASSAMRGDEATSPRPAAAAKLSPAPATNQAPEHGSQEAQDDEDEFDTSCWS